MKTKTMSIAQFIEDNGITMAVTRIPKRPDVAKDDWHASARHFLCTLYRGGHNTGKGPQEADMQVYFSQGSAHTKSPTAEDVLDCLASDTSAIENARGSFEDWCTEYGYDTDSRKAYSTFQEVSCQAAELKEFLGDAEDFEQLLWNIERL